MASKYFKYLMIVPALIILAMVTFYPMINSFWISLHEWDLTTSNKIGQFIGLDNYIRAFKDPIFWNSVKVTLIFTLATVFITIALAILIGLLLSRDKKYLSFIRAILIIPFALSPALVGYSWKFMLNPDYGVFDKIIGTIFPPLDHIVWLGNPMTALFSLVSVAVWIWLPFMSLMFISGIMGLPEEVYEAARMDGANYIQIFFKITLPLLRPIILLATILMTMFALKQFDPIVTMTSGGPGNSTEVLNFLVYQTSFRYFEMGYGAALGYILAIITIIFVMIYMRKLVKGDEWS
ncbi:sugar ABC transporter permease [Mammaliicoccus sciuri]|uniref:carbohydrate ABC transporter permease n=1 Tax=Mammaliicoccus sciuri TaxID=1296 RepID=UPI002DBDEEFA|nr:sugar ABC transporter permease [Mammaliicoccus sciuri]MEB6253288.1 sugar ABC transporter permease [Mammaliicoccus sciuri]